MDFFRSLKRKIPVVVHAHVTAARFDEARAAADRYLAVSPHMKDKLVAEKNFPPARSRYCRTAWTRRYSRRHARKIRVQKSTRRSKCR